MKTPWQEDNFIVTLMNGDIFCQAGWSDAQLVIRPRTGHQSSNLLRLCHVEANAIPSMLLCEVDTKWPDPFREGPLGFHQKQLADTAAVR